MILFHLLLSTIITSTQGNTFFLIPFGAGFANTFPHVVPGVEIKAMYEIIVSHALEQSIWTLNCEIPASPPQCLTVTEGINNKFNLLGFVIPTERSKSNYSDISI